MSILYVAGAILSEDASTFLKSRHLLYHQGRQEFALSNLYHPLMYFSNTQVGRNSLFAFDGLQYVPINDAMGHVYYVDISAARYAAVGMVQKNFVIVQFNTTATLQQFNSLFSYLLLQLFEQHLASQSA